MENALFKIVEISESKRIDITFIKELHHNELISIIVINTEEFIDENDLSNLERYSNWYYDLELNMQGIEIVSDLLNKITLLKEEIRLLKKS